MNNPTLVEGLTMIFNKVRDEQKSNVANTVGGGSRHRGTSQEYIMNNINMLWLKNGFVVSKSTYASV